MTRAFALTLGDLIATTYEELFELYGDEELTTLATSAVINELLASSEPAASARAE